MFVLIHRLEINLKFRWRLENIKHILMHSNYFSLCVKTLQKLVASHAFIFDLSQFFGCRNSLSRFSRRTLTYNQVSDARTVFWRPLETTEDTALLCLVFSFGFSCHGDRVLRRSLARAGSDPYATTINLWPSLRKSTGSLHPKLFVK